jgi:hypothetical protein
MTTLERWAVAMTVASTGARSRTSTVTLSGLSIGPMYGRSAMIPNSGDAPRGRGAVHQKTGGISADDHVRAGRLATR